MPGRFDRSSASSHIRQSLAPTAHSNLPFRSPWPHLEFVCDSPSRDLPCTDIRIIIRRNVNCKRGNFTSESSVGGLPQEPFHSGNAMDFRATPVGKIIDQEDHGNWLAVDAPTVRRGYRLIGLSSRKARTNSRKTVSIPYPFVLFLLRNARAPRPGPFPWRCQDGDSHQTSRLTSG